MHANKPQCVPIIARDSLLRLEDHPRSKAPYYRIVFDRGKWINENKNIFISNRCVPEGTYLKNCAEVSILVEDFIKIDSGFNAFLQSEIFTGKLSSYELVKMYTSIYVEEDVDLYIDGQGLNFYVYFLLYFARVLDPLLGPDFEPNGRKLNDILKGGYQNFLRQTVLIYYEEDKTSYFSDYLVSRCVFSGRTNVIRDIHVGELEYLSPITYTLHFSEEYATIVQDVRSCLETFNFDKVMDKYLRMIPILKCLYLVCTYTQMTKIEIQKYFNKLTSGQLAFCQVYYDPIYEILIDFSPEQIDAITESDIRFFNLRPHIEDIRLKHAEDQIALSVLEVWVKPDINNISAKEEIVINNDDKVIINLIESPHEIQIFYRRFQISLIKVLRVVLIRLLVIMIILVVSTINYYLVLKFSYFDQTKLFLRLIESVRDMH